MAQDSRGRSSASGMSRGRWVSYQPFSFDKTGCARLRDEIGLDPRQVPQVLRLAVALVEAGEDAEHLRGALRAHDGVGAGERRDVEFRIGRLALARIEADELAARDPAAPSPARPAEARRRRRRAAQHRILEIDEADAREALPLRQPDQVRRVVVAQRPGGRAGDDLDQDLGPEIDEFRPRRAGELGADDVRHVPVGQQLRLDQQRFEIVGRERVVAARPPPAGPAAGSWPWSFARSARRFRVALRDRPARVDDRLVAEILEEQEAGIEILAVDPRRAEARARAGPGPWPRRRGRSRRASRWRCRACRAAPAARPGAAARSSGWRSRRRASPAARRPGSMRRPGSAGAPRPPSRCAPRGRGRPAAAAIRGREGAGRSASRCGPAPAAGSEVELDVEPILFSARRRARAIRRA